MMRQWTIAGGSCAVRRQPVARRRYAVENMRSFVLAAALAGLMMNWLHPVSASGGVIERLPKPRWRATIIAASAPSSEVGGPRHRRLIGTVRVAVIPGRWAVRWPATKSEKAR
jgi:hypothetical protein